MASPASDLREWIALLEHEGELVRISAEVDPDLEIADRTVAAGGPAFILHPVAFNVTRPSHCPRLGGP